MSDSSNDDLGRASAPFDRVKDAVVAYPSGPRSLESSKQPFAGSVGVGLDLGECVIDRVLQVGRELFEVRSGFSG